QGEQAICSTIATKFVNDGVDLIMAIATPAAQAAAQATKDIPILVTAVTDPVSAGLAASNEAPGGNVSGTSDMNPVAQQVDLLIKLAPEAKTVGIMYNSSEDNSILQANMAREALEAKGLTVMDFTVSASNEVQAVAQTAVSKVDAIYIPTDNLLADTMATVSMVATPAGIPIICGESNMVNAGGLATYGISYKQLGLQTAAQAVKILSEGADTATMPIEYCNADLELTINEEIASQLGITIPADLK
ncbi:MAG: ABC transporter substrate-binding protein, partial [Clostridia bacterium]|nr:ABC transporter substrate-binding protein [Clostridia bacterium]